MQNDSIGIVFSASESELTEEEKPPDPSPRPIAARLSSPPSPTQLYQPFQAVAINRPPDLKHRPPLEILRLLASAPLKTGAKIGFLFLWA